VPEELEEVDPAPLSLHDADDRDSTVERDQR
jgi:hypothetical protein